MNITSSIFFALDPFLVTDLKLILFSKSYELFLLKTNDFIIFRKEFMLIIKKFKQYSKIQREKQFSQIPVSLTPIRGERARETEREGGRTNYLFLFFSPKEEDPTLMTSFNLYL